MYGFEGEKMEFEIEIEEGEAYDSTVDPDVSLSYIDEKIQDGLGDCQKDFEGGVSAENLNLGPPAPSVPSSYAYGNPSKKIEIPNVRVDVNIGKAGETIKYLQLQSGANIQVTRDMDADPHLLTREVELTGSAESLEKAEQLIRDVLAEAESGGSGIVSRRVGGQPGGAEQFVMQIPNKKVLTLKRNCYFFWEFIAGNFQLCT